MIDRLRSMMTRCWSWNGAALASRPLQRVTTAMLVSDASHPHSIGCPMKQVSAPAETPPHQLEYWYALQMQECDSQPSAKRRPLRCHRLTKTFIHTMFPQASLLFAAPRRHSEPDSASAVPAAGYLTTSPHSPWRLRDGNNSIRTPHCVP